MKRKNIHILLYLLIIALSGILLGLAASHRDNQKIAKIRIDMHSPDETHFLSKEDIRSIVENATSCALSSCKLGEIGLLEVEMALHNNPYVFSANVHYTLEGELVVKVEQRKAIARLIDRSGRQFYLDEQLHKMPTSPQHSPNVILISGAFSETEAGGEEVQDTILQTLLPMINDVSKDAFWAAQISEIVLLKDGSIVLYPELGQAEIEFGKIDNYKEKLDNLLLFYKKVLVHSGWDRYPHVCVKFKDQIVVKEE